MLEELKVKVCKANLDLVKYGLVIFTWGNASGIDRKKSLVVIKPSGVSYDKMKPEDMVVLNLNGELVEGKLNPSSDAHTHIELYRNFEGIGGIVHTHSKYASAWAQAGKSIPCFGTTHADYFFGDIPCTRRMSHAEVKDAYEKETGRLIIETFCKINPEEMPGVLVHSHGPFNWGKSPDEAVLHAVVLENIAEMAYHTVTINPETKSIEDFLLERHFKRKHGKNAYYGQNKSL